MYLFKYGIPSARGANRTEDDAEWRSHANLGVRAVNHNWVTSWRYECWEYYMGPFVVFR